MKNINISAPMIFDMEYCKKIVKLNEEATTNGKDICVYEMYGALKEDIIGNLRPAKTLKYVSMSEMETYITFLHKHNIRFSYVINSTVSDGTEYTDEGRVRILNFIDSLVKIGVDNFTITSPYFIRMISAHFDNIGITASICNEIDTVQKAKQFEKIGSKCIVINRDINRDFEMIKAIRKNVNCDLKVLCTTPCIYRCMDVYYHSNLSSTMSNGLKTAISVPENEYSHTSTNCLYKKVSDLSENIKSPWIRPEDMKYYAKMGVNYFKIDGRDKSADYNIDVITAYMNENYDGNLLYLMNDGYPQTIEGVYNEKDRSYIKIAVDNKKMDNYIKAFLDGKIDCRRGCDDCGYCKGIADKYVVVNEDWRDTFSCYLRGENERRLGISC